MQKARAVRGQDLCCLMSNPAEKPEVVQLPAEPQVAAPVEHPPRRGAAGARGARPVNVDQRNPPCFRHRVAPAICPDPGVGVLCRHAAGGCDRRAVRHLDAAGVGGGLDRRHALRPRRHHSQLQPVPRGEALARRHAQMANAICGARPALRSVLDRGPGPPGRTRRRLQHDDDVPDAAGDRGVEHAGGEPADRGAGGNRAGDGGHRARFHR